MDRLLTKEEFAERLGVCTRTVNRLLHERKIACVKIGRCVRFDPAQVAEVARTFTVPALPQRSSAKTPNCTPRAVSQQSTSVRMPNVSEFRERRARRAARLQAKAAAKAGAA